MLWFDAKHIFICKDANWGDETYVGTDISFPQFSFS